jgi:hypothetical protein
MILVHMLVYLLHMQVHFHAFLYKKGKLRKGAERIVCLLVYTASLQYHSFCHS